MTSFRRIGGQKGLESHTTIYSMRKRDVVRHPAVAVSECYLIFAFVYDVEDVLVAADICVVAVLFSVVVDPQRIFRG